MDSWVVGTTVRMEATIRDALTDELIDPTEVVCRLRAPDRTRVDVPATKLSVGLYAAEVVPNVPGVWTYRFEGSGTQASANEGSFFIRESSVV